MRQQKRSGAIAASIAMSKTPQLRPSSKPTISQEHLPQVRQSQLPSVSTSKQPAPSPKSERAERSPVKTKSKVTDDMDPFEASEVLRREIYEEFNELHDSSKEPEMPWYNSLDKLNNQLTENIKKSQAIDLSFINTFDDATKDYVGDENDAISSATEMMNIGFDAVHKKLHETQDIIDQRTSLVQQMMNEMQQHGVNEFAADLKLDKLPLFDDLEDTMTTTEGGNNGTLQPPTGTRNAPARPRK